MVIYLLLKLIIEDRCECSDYNIVGKTMMDRSYSILGLGIEQVGLLWACQQTPISPSWLLMDRLSAYSVKRNSMAGSKRPLERFQCAAIEKMKGGKTLKTTEEIAVCCQDLIYIEVILGALYTLVKGNKVSVN